MTPPELLPAGSRPAAMIATVCGIGRLPGAPGTWASAVALPPAWGLWHLGGAAAIAAGVVVLLLIGTWAAARYVADTGIQDPPSVVIDEVMAQWLTLVAVPADPALYLMGFLLFRAFDIFKPWPANWADRTLEGGVGVMADDFLAGSYAALALIMVAWLLEKV